MLQQLQQARGFKAVALAVLPLILTSVHQHDVTRGMLCAALLTQPARQLTARERLLAAGAGRTDHGAHCHWRAPAGADSVANSLLHTPLLPLCLY